MKVFKTVLLLMFQLISAIDSLGQTLKQESVNVSQLVSIYQFLNSIESGYFEVEKEIVKIDLGKQDTSITNTSLKIHFLKNPNGRVDYWCRMGNNDYISLEDIRLSIYHKTNTVYQNLGSGIPPFETGLAASLMYQNATFSENWFNWKLIRSDSGVVEFLLETRDTQSSSMNLHYREVRRYKDSLFIFFETDMNAGRIRNIQTQKLIKAQTGIYDSILFNRFIRAYVRDSLKEYNFITSEKEANKSPILDSGIFIKPWNFYELTGEKYRGTSGKITVLNFVHDDCLPCKMLEDDLMKIDSMFKGKNLEIIIVNPIDSVDRIKAHNDKTNYDLKTLTADKNYCQTNFAFQGYPRIYVISPEGNLLATYKGHSLDNVKNLKKLLAEQL